jgi:4-amino-4-deoxy-L-arabinose transferase-like glycosyltransferase
LGLLLFSGLLLLPGLTRARAFEDTDARYLEIARAMFESGDWLMPRLAGEPHLDKPPLTYWAAAAGYGALGVGPFAGRLLSNLALAATALGVLAAGRRWCGAGGATPAALLLLTCSLVYTTSRALQTDLLQLLFFTAAMLSFGAAVERPGRPALLVLALALLGVSMNAKGPIALFVALFVWVPFLVLSRARAALPARFWLGGAVLFVLVGAPWYVLLATRDPEVLRQWLDVQLLGRISGQLHHHIHVPFYLLGVWPLGLLPWTPLVALALWRLRPRAGWRHGDPLDLYLALWATLPVVFFSLPRSQSAQYVLPAFPAAALAVGRVLRRGGLADGRARGALIASGCLVAALAVALALGLLVPDWIASGKLETQRLVGREPFAASLLGVAAALLWVVWRLPRRLAPRSLLTIACGTGLVFALGFEALAPGLVSFEPEGRLAKSVPGAALVQYGVWRPSALYYFGHVERFAYIPGPRRRPTEATGSLVDPGREALLARLQGGEPVFCMTRRRLAKELMEASGATLVRARPKEVLLANRAAQDALAPRRTRSLD